MAELEKPIQGASSVSEMSLDEPVYVTIVREVYIFPIQAERFEKNWLQA